MTNSLKQKVYSYISIMLLEKLFTFPLQRLGILGSQNELGK